MDQKTARSRLGIGDQSSVGIIFISHVAFANERKGTGILMEALKQVNQEALFLVLGENSQAWAGRCPQRTFTFPFTKDPSVLRDVINAGDIMVQPSVLENLPNTLLEGMSCGKPAVVFDRGGMRDAVESNVQGFCLKEASANTLSGAINYLIADEKARKQMGKAAREKMLQLFNLQQEINAYEKLYFSLLN
jgi:glycosyltransferase involved in cell wall biosynthesis